ncbi:hypothetical protein KAS41_01365 [Candidatus Parcubacteria bacterium]|nr:hypothetical protein [Candidatus Parcubacteria bacterium]
MFKKSLLVFSLSVLSLTLSACSINFGGSKAPPSDAGVYKSADAGEKWAQIKLVPSISGAPGSIANISAVDMAMDPQDNKAIYLGTERSGIYYTYDGGTRWSKLKGFPNGKVNSIAVDPNSKCVIYATLGRFIKKTTDCGRTWRDIFIEDGGAEITEIAIDSYNTNIIYVGTSKGKLYKSFDQGRKWSTPFNSISGNIAKILIDPIDTRIIYFATLKKGIFKSTDAGVNISDIKESLENFKGYNNYRNLIFNPSKQNSLFLLCKYGLLKTEDGGESWSAIPLLTAPNQADVRVIAVDPKNDKNIFYTTKTTFYKTTNSGSDWKPKKLFSTKTPTNFLIDPEDSNILYMSFNFPPPK